MASTSSTGAGAEVGTRVVHRRYVPYSHAHYAGNLVDGAYSLGLFGDVATEMCILTDGDEGLFASYSDVQFKQPVRAGDVLEIVCEITRVGTRSRTLDFTVHVVARGAATDDAPGAAAHARRAAPRHLGDGRRRRSLTSTSSRNWSEPVPRRVASRHAGAVRISVNFW